jgi:hypothetical protein
MSHATPTLRKIVTEANRGEKIIPVIRAYLYDPNFPSFEVKVKGSSQRAPDGWFHPSTHPTWGERQLWYYLYLPELLVNEPLDPLGAMATTAGNFWHSFISVIGIESGILKAVDVPVQDDDTGARGEMDGETVDEGFEFKTMNELKLAKLPKQAGPEDPEVLEWLRQKCPQYYGQVQEYMRLSGYTSFRMVILHTGYPFDMREIRVLRDEKFINDVREKYLRVRQAVADQVMPQPCCGARSEMAKACPAKEACPIALV